MNFLFGVFLLSLVAISTFISLWISLLQKKNQELRDILDASIAGMAIFDNGKCVDVNTVCLTQSDYTKEEIIGKSFFDFVDESEYEYLA